MARRFWCVANYFPKTVAICGGAGKNDGLMSLHAMSEPLLESSPEVPKRVVVTEPDYSQPPRPIAEFAGRADFPKCALGEYLDIAGYAGVLVEIVNQSIRVKSPEGILQNFNIQRLRTIHAPVVRPEPLPTPMAVEPPVKKPTKAKPAAAAEEVEEAPPREYIAEPDYAQPIKPIRAFAGQADFPKCAYGAYVDIAGFSGVVVEIVKQSIKVLPQDGTTRSFNTAVLRKLYGQ